MVGAPVLVWLLASGFQNQGEAQAAVLMTRWMFPYIGFMSLGGAVLGRAQYLQALCRTGGYAGAAQSVHDWRGLAAGTVV